MASAITPDPEGAVAPLKPDGGDVLDAAAFLVHYQPLANDLARIGVIVDLLIFLGNVIEDGIYSEKSILVSSQEGQPTGLTLSPDGTKAYIVGAVNDTVFQYTLTTPFDISTGSYASKSMDFSSEETDAGAVTLSPDGTKAYIVGTANDTVYQYTLTTPFDISTGSYASKSMSVAGEETLPQGLTLSVDGTKAYIVGTVNDTVYQYTLTTPFDISTGSYASKSMSVAGEDVLPSGLAFSSDGTKAFITGLTNDTVYQYTLSTAWDISTGSYASKSFLTQVEDSLPRDLIFSADGTKMYIMGGQNARIYQYYTTKCVKD